MNSQHRDAAVASHCPLINTAAYSPFVHGGAVKQHTLSRCRTPVYRFPFYHFEGCLGGELVVVINDEEVILPSGSVVFLPPGIKNYVSVGPSLGMQVWLNFDLIDQPNRFQRGLGRSLVAPDGWPVGQAWSQPAPQDIWGCDIGMGPYPGFAASLAGLVDSWQRHHATGNSLMNLWKIRQKIDALMYQLFVQQPGSCPGHRGSVEERLAHAESVACQNVDQPFGVHQFALAAGYSRSYFSVLYEQVRGYSPKHFLERQRLLLSQRLLVDTQMTIKEVAHQVGFGSQAAFSNFFRRLTDQSPRVWRQGHR